MTPQFMQPTNAVHASYAPPTRGGMAASGGMQGSGGLSGTFGSIGEGAFNQRSVQDGVLLRALQEDPNYLQSLSIATGFPYNATAWQRQRDIMDQTAETKRLAFQEVNVFLLENWRYFDALFAKWRENVRFKNHIHWTPADIKKILDAGQQPYISPHMWRWIMSLFGEQRSAKTAWETEPKSPDSAEFTELANGILQCFGDINDWPRVNSKIFEDGAVGGIGFGMCSLDPMDPTANILIDRCPPWQFMWSREAKNGSLDNARLIVRGYWHSLEELIMKFPVWGNTLLKYNPSTFYRDHQFLFRIAEPEVQSIVTDIGQNVQMPNEMLHRVGRRIFLLECYRRRPKHVFRVTDANFSIDHDFDNLPQSIEFFATLREAYRAANIARTGDDSADPMVLQPREAYKTVTDQEIWCGDMLLDKQTIDEEAAIPYEAFIPFFDDGTITGMFEGEKSRERMRDRIMIYFDMIAGASKAKTTINIAKLPRDLRNDLQKVKRVMSRANEILFLDDRSPDADVNRVVSHSSVPNNGQLADQLLRFLDDGSSTTLGGMTAIGQPDYAGQSGVSQETNMQGASLGTIPLFDEKEIFDRRMGEKVIINARSLDPRIVLSTTDKRDQTRFFRVIDHGVSSLHELRFRVKVKNVTDSPSVRDRKLRKVLLLLQNAGPELQSAVLPEILELSDMEVTRIDRIVQRFQQAQEQEQQQAEDDQHIQRLNLVMKWEDMKAHRRTELMQAMTKANPPVNTTLQLKGSAGPGMIAEVMNQHQIPADTQGVIADMAAGALVQQPIDDMQQAHYNQLEIELERQLTKVWGTGDAMGNGKSGGKKSAGKSAGKGTAKGAGRPKGTGGRPLTPKDKKARSTT